MKPSKRTVFYLPYRRQLIPPFVLACFVWSVWLFLIGFEQGVSLVSSHWEVAITMIFGSLIAGASSEGGGAVAFPVFTKVLAVAPRDAKLFALAIQSVGMSCASLTIFFNRIRIDKKAILLASLGGVPGIWVSIVWLGNIFPPAETKVFFSAMQAGFALTLLWSWKGQGQRDARLCTPRSLSTLLFLGVGFFGGIASGLVGSGIDLVVFSLLVLLFRVSEKISTPTSVVIMAVNSIAGMVVYNCFVGPLPKHVVEMWLSAIPIVVVGAPLGAIICSNLTRFQITAFLLALIAIEVVSTIALIPWSRSTISVGVIALLSFISMYGLMARASCFLARGEQEIDPLVGD